MLTKSINLKKLEALKTYLLEGKFPIVDSMSIELEEFTVYEGTHESERPLFEGLEVISQLEPNLGETVAVGGTGFNCYSFKIKIQDVGFIGYLKTNKIPADLEPSKTVVFWNNKTLLPNSKEHLLNDFIHCVDKHIIGLKNELAVEEKVEKEYPVHHEEHEVIQTPMNLKKKNPMTLEEALKRIAELEEEVRTLKWKE